MVEANIDNAWNAIDRLDVDELIEILIDIFDRGEREEIIMKLQAHAHEL